MSKLWHTIKLCSTLALARTFGEYENSGWNGECDFAIYSWRGQSWFIPLGPYEAPND